MIKELDTMERSYVWDIQVKTLYHWIWISFEGFYNVPNINTNDVLVLGLPLGGPKKDDLC